MQKIYLFLIWAISLDDVLKYAIIVVLILMVAFLLVSNNRRRLKREEEKFKLNTRLHEMEIKVIKAQMNPHFMFNSLNSIQQFIITNENEKAQYYLSKFSRLIRKLLESTTKDSVSLLDEIDILNRYLEIEALRFNNVFKYTVEVTKDIDVANTCIPHFLIQPFVENAIWHGLLPKKGDKYLTVHFEMQNKNQIVCTIDDNGIGRKKNEGKQNLEKKSLAINFIKQRLDLMNKNLGMNLSLNIIDKVDYEGNSEGTKVILVLPMIKQTYV